MPVRVASIDMSSDGTDMDAGAPPTQVDAVVVGAGTAGANVAYQLAARGLSVVVLERRALADGGAQWHNGVLDRHFERAGLEPPHPPERHHSAGSFHMFGPSGQHVFTMVGPPTVTADMSLLGRRLRSMAAEHGVTFIDQIESLTPILDGDRLVGVDLPGYTVAARLFVDASGRTGVLRRVSPALDPWCPTVRNDELCSASDFRFGIDDPSGAERFLQRHGAARGDHINTVGLAGGYSTCNMSVSPDLDQVSILVGCVANGRYGTGPKMIEAVRAREGWIGDPLDGGSGVIPLRRPYSRFTAPGLALVGDSACQVFPAHGSGIGMGLIAGTMLAEVVGSAAELDEDIGDASVLWRYQHAFMSEFGGLLSSFDAFRRMSTALGSRGVDGLMSAGLVSEDLTRAGLDQRLATPAPSTLPMMALKLLSRPGLAGSMLPMLARMQILRVVGTRHPVEPDLVALERWDRWVERLLGPLPS